MTIFNDPFNSAWKSLSKQSLGFDSLFNYVETVSRDSTNFPPYNLSVDDNKNPKEYLLEFAVAGYSRDDLSVRVLRKTGASRLIISGSREKDDGRVYVQRGLAARSFTRELAIADGVVVDSVELKDGILAIKLKIEVDEKPVEILTIK